MRPSRFDPATLLTVHSGLYALALAIANGFAGAFLLRMGFSLPSVILMYAVFLLLRFGVRMAAIAFVRRFGYRRAILAGVAVVATQFVPLAHADRPACLAAWIACMSIGESMYWPTLHACTAVAGSSDSWGRQLGLRAAFNSCATILGPLVGGVVLQRFGSVADFSLGAAVMLLSLAPILLCPDFPAGAVPGVRDSYRGGDRRAQLIFLNDGWMAAGWLSIWAVEYFLLLGSRYEAFGIATAAAGLVGAGVSLAGGRLIDAGKRRAAGSGRGGNAHLRIVAGGLLLSFVLRVGAGWSGWAALAANLSGSAMLGAYTPLMMARLYERAKNSSGPFRFHLALEGAWDAGGVLGHLTGALVAWLLPGAMTLAMLPGMLGVATFYALMRQKDVGAAVTA